MRLYRAGSSTPLTAKLENISGGGLFFTTSAPAMSGERFMCEISLPIKPDPYGASAVLQCELVVVRSVITPQAEDTVCCVACRFCDYCVQLPRREAPYWRVPSLAS